MNRFNLFMLTCMVSCSLSAQNARTKFPERIINTDFSKEKGLLNTMFKECVGAGRANEGLRADWQQ